MSPGGLRARQSSNATGAGVRKPGAKSKKTSSGDPPKSEGTATANARTAACTRASARLAKIRGSRKYEKSPPPRTQVAVAGSSRSVVEPVELKVARRSGSQTALIRAKPLGVKVSLPFFHENVIDWNYSGKPVTTYNFNESDEGLKSRYRLYHHLKIMSGGFLLHMDHIITKLDGEKFKCVYKVGEYVRIGKTREQINHFATIVMTTEADVASYFVFQIVNPGLAAKYHIGVSELRKACEISFATPVLRCLQKDGRRFNEEKVTEEGQVRRLMERATAKAVASAAESVLRLESNSDDNE